MPSNYGSRKLRPLVITMGGPRQEAIRELFAQMSDDFEEPVFSPGVPSRSIRNRLDLWSHFYDLGLIPQAEWDVIQANKDNPEYQLHPERMDEIFDRVPVEPRFGSDNLHYATELWRKARGVNRGRAVLACTVAHLFAIRTLHEQDLDFILEDNVRAPVEECAARIREACQQQKECHFRFYGWLGSVPNLRWIHNHHMPRCSSMVDDETCVFPLPTLSDLEETRVDGVLPTETGEREPGGNMVWGCYAYWISKEAYEAVLDKLRHDVGSLLWRGKRARFYTVTPIDKLLPRKIAYLFGGDKIYLARRPAFFRAPMLTSKIHTQWDPEFCKSTEFQLKQSGLDWDNLWLTETERAVVEHKQRHGDWLTPSQLAAIDNDAEGNE